MKQNRNKSRTTSGTFLPEHTRPVHQRFPFSLLRRTALWCAVGLLSPFSSYAMEVERLRTEAVKNPVGIDVEKPMFSWMMDADNERGIWQTAYEISVFTDAAHSEQVWTSGRIESDCQIDVPYDGNPLSPSTRYYWTVTVWDNKGRESTSSEEAYFETGLLGSGWDGARWIKATDTPLATSENAITHYSVEADFEIDNLSAGIIFASNAEHSHYHMWQVNLEAGYPRFRPHIWRGPDLADATCLAEIDLRPFIDVQLHKSYHLRIEVDGDVARTYIDDVLIDTRTNPDGGDYGYGTVGIRQDRALNNYNDTERAYFDNFTVTDLEGESPKILLHEDFSDENNPFTTGQIKDRRLFIEASYSWYNPMNTPTVYALDLDFLIERDNAGIIFSGYDTDNFHLWGINVRDKETPFLHRHVKTNGAFSSNDADLGKFFTKAELTGSLHHLTLKVNGTTVETYIDGTLVDTYTDTSGRLKNGLIGFRTYHDLTMDEMAYYDNIKVTTYDEEDGTQGTVTFSEDFEGAGMAFSDGTVITKKGSKMLCVHSTYEETCAMQTGTEKGIPLFRKAFTAKSTVKSAKIYASALGVFDLFINGKRVGQDGTTMYDELKPGWTDYRKEINYMTYDVTPLIQEGENAVGAQVSNGWWGGAIAHGMYGSPSLGFIAKLRLEYEDGTIENIVTGTDWSCSYCGPVISGDIYNGETYDARRESDWSMPEYDTSEWFATAENTEFNGEITAFRSPTVKVRDFLRRTPQTITVYEGTKASGTTYGTINVVRTLEGTETLRLKAGETALFDLGQNMTGWIRFTTKGERGTKLRFKFGEMLNDTGAADRANDGPGGSLYTYNLRTAEATLHYTLKGTEEGETFQPSTTFFGFRYCEVTTTSDVEISKLTGEFVGSDLEELATFETSHPDINQLYSNIIWSQRDNFLSVPTDCPQRDERLGWTGDTQVFARAASYNTDTRAFYRKWLNDLRQSQREDGAYPEIAPFCNFWGFGNSGWADAGVIVPWTVYLMTDDQSVLSESYASMSLYMDWLSTQSGGGFKYNGAGTATGDWLSYETTDGRYVSVCYYAYVAQLMSKISGVLSEAQADRFYLDSLKYSTLYENIKEEFQRRYLNSDGLPNISTQASYLMALKFGLLPETAIGKAREVLRKKITDNGYKLSTGFLGTSILNQTLSAEGMDDLAYDLLLQRENPSWLYSVDQGATTIWERWDSYTKEGGFNKHPWIMNSFNHYSYGVVSEWMFRYVGGIEADETQPGFKHIILQPTPDFRTAFPTGQKRITQAKASHLSGYGRISSEWQYKEDGRISYTATVPANTTATLYLPLMEKTDNITESGKDLKEAEGVDFKGIVDGKAVIELQSGTYQFDMEKGSPDRVEESTSPNLRIHPNHFCDRLHLSCSEDIRYASVTACNGQILYRQHRGGNIDTSAWAPGIYVVRVDTPEHSYTEKAIKK